MEPQQKQVEVVPYKPGSLDYNKVQERASQGYYREYWSSTKGRVRGMLSGVMVGAAIGLAMGAAVAGILAYTGVLAAIAAAAAASGAAPITAIGIIAGFTGLTAIKSAEAYGSAGSAAASRAAGLAERHARVLDPVYKNNETAALDDKLMMDGRGHHFQFPVDRDKGKLFNWKSGALGALIGAGLAALIASSGVIGLFGVTTALAIGEVAGAAIGGAGLGMTFGIDRSRLKDIFNKVDASSWGKSKGDYAGIDMGRKQFGGVENDKQLAEHRMQRQASTFALEEEYHNKIYARAVKGLFRGLAGGAVAGAAIGAAVGLLACAVVAPFATGAIGVAAVTTGFAAVGMNYGIRVFADAGREAGAESMARAIDNEFERNLELRQKGITPTPPKPMEQRFLNPKAALVMASIGAAVAAIALPGIIATGAFAALGLEAAAATTGATLAASAAIGGVFGTMYGIGRDSLKSLSKFTDWLYDKTYVVHNDPTSKPYVVPLPSREAEQAAQAAIAKPANGHAITGEDMNRLDEKMRARPQKTFEQSVLAQNAQPATPTL